MKKKPKAAPFQNKGWTRYQAIQNLLLTKPKGLNVYHPGRPMTWEENGNDLPAGDFDDPSDSSTNEDTGLHHSDEEDDGEEPIPWVSQVISSINGSSHVCPQEQTPPREAPVRQSSARQSLSPISQGHKHKPSNLLSLSTTCSSTRSSTPTIKKQCTSTGAALEGLGDRLTEFNETFQANNEPRHGAGIKSTPACKRTTICRAQELETDLAIEHVVALIHIFKGNVSAVDAYVVLKHEELRKLWVRSKLGLV